MTRNVGRFALVAIAALTMAGASAIVEAKGPPDSGGDEGFGNNLSVPALFVPDTTGAPALRIPTVDEAVAPADTVDQPVYYDEVTFTDADGNVTVIPAGWYYEQKSTATWQADWSTAQAADVIADWGDNLTDAPNLKARQPLRVEMTLYQHDVVADVAVTATGLQVVKLTDDLDRYATYGTDGALVDEMPVRVFDAGAKLTIKNVDTNAYVLDHAVMGAEINSTGGIVYGFNWGIQGRKSTPEAGTYELTFETVATTIVGIEDGDAIRVPTWESGSTTLTITLGARSNPGGGSVGGGGGPGAGGGGGR